jgi:alpha-1,4-digalacturonate transport system substrate-binding protein
MNRKSFLVWLTILLVVLTACGPAAAPTEAPTEAAPTEAPTEAPPPTEAPTDEVELRFTYYADGNEADVIRPILDKFEDENPGVTVILDVVPYSTIDEQLPVQVETGEGPDLARITNFGAYQGKLLDLREYLADPAYYEANFQAPILKAMGYGGFPDALTVTGPYVNKTLFDQAGVDMPGEGATWADWTEATQAVAEATGVQYAISIDRTGHRFAGPAMSMGATLIDEGDNFVIDTPGFRAFTELLNDWHEEGITPPEVWLVGDSMNSCIDFFKSGDLVMCMSGSWQIGGLAADVGDAFDWVVVPNPTGDGGSTGVAGGSAVAAFADTEHPEAVARLMAFLMQPENYAAFSAGTLALPAHNAVASAGVDFDADNESVLNALAGYTAEIPKLQDQAVGLNVHPFAFAYYRNSANRIAQYLTGELSLDEALQRLQQDIDDAIAEATGEKPVETPLEAAELRFTYYADGNEADVIRPILDKFEDENPGVTVILDVVPYSTIDEQLPVQVETGEGPDLARITNFGAYQGKLLDLREYLADPAYYEANFQAPILKAMGYGGFPDALTVTGPYVNKTLFDQAGVDMPGEGATWADWTEATQAVAEATGVQYAISIDRTGHRFAGPAMSMGATLIDEGDNFVIDTPGFRAFTELLNDWHEEGITPPEVWLVGDSMNSCIDFFKSGDLVMCMSGSWQIGGLAADVGDAFDWVVVPNPTGDGGSTGVAGGSAVAAFADTEHPEAVARLMAFLMQPENYAAFSAGTLALPAHNAVASAGVDFDADNESVLNALAGYTAEIPKLQDQAVGLNVHPFAFAYYRNSANRIAQYLTGELTLDEALQRLQQDIDDAITEAEG